MLNYPYNSATWGVVAALLLIGHTGPRVNANEPSPGGEPAANVHLFATGFTGHSALAIDPQGNLLATNYRVEGAVGRISPEQGATTLFHVEPRQEDMLAASPLVGIALDADGRVFALDTEHGRLWRWNPEIDQLSLLGDRFQGRRFHSLFAVAVGSGRDIFFSEPQRTMGREGTGTVYRYDAATNRITLLAENLDQPTGLCLTFSDQWLYIAESGNQRILGWNLRQTDTAEPSRSLSLDKVAAEMGLDQLGRIGHLAVDRRGWIYVALWDRGSVAVVDSEEGTLLEVIPTGGQRVFGLALRHESLLMSIPDKEAVYQYDLRPLIGRHAP